MLTVAFDSGPLHGPATGIARATTGLLHALEGRDDICIIEYLLSFRASTTPKVRRLPLPARPALEFWGRTGRPRVDRRLRGADVIHGTNYVVPPSRLPRVVSVYDCWALENADLVHPDVRAAMRVLQRSIGDGAHVHASSKATADRLLHLFPGVSVTVVHLGDVTVLSAHASDGARVPEELESGRPFVLALGTREKRKNLPTLIRSFAELSTIHPDLTLAIAGGSGDDDRAVDEAVARLAPTDRRRVLLLGRVDDATASWLLDHARALAYPSLDEGFGFPLLEAMAHRTPIVASDIGSIPEVVADAALLVSPLDVEGWAASISRVLSDDGLATTLVNRGETRRGHFSWSRAAQEMVDLYRRVAETGA